MSSGAVRSAFRSALVAQFPSVPYVDTLAKNVNMEGLPSLWMAVDFETAPTTRLSIGSPALWREVGSSVITVVGETGNGDAVVVAQADAVASYFRQWQSAPINLIVTGTTIRTDVGEDSDGRWFFIVVSVGYERTFLN